MSRNLRPENFLGCNLIDKTFLDENGFFLSSGNNEKIIGHRFGRYYLEFYYCKYIDHMTLLIYHEGHELGLIRYSLIGKPNFEHIVEETIMTREGFLEKMMPLDKDLAFWLLWNI